MSSPSGSKVAPSMATRIPDSGRHRSAPEPPGGSFVALRGATRCLSHQDACAGPARLLSPCEEVSAS